MYKLVVIVALLAAATCGLPTTGVDPHGASGRPETTGEGVRDLAQKSGVEDPVELRGESIPGAPRPKRGFCLGIVTVCPDDGGAGKEVANKIIDSNQQNLQVVATGFVQLAGTLTNRNNRQPAQDPTQQTSDVYIIPE